MVMRGKYTGNRPGKSGIHRAEPTHDIPHLPSPGSGEFITRAEVPTRALASAPFTFDGACAAAKRLRDRCLGWHVFRLQEHLLYDAQGGGPSGESYWEVWAQTDDARLAEAAEAAQGVAILTTRADVTRLYRIEVALGYHEGVARV